MASIISDVDDRPIDTRSLAAEIRDARSQRTAATPARTAPASETPAEPRRFAGKSREEVMEMYTHLESHSGRLANQVGQLQNAVQDLIVDKRARDLRANGEAQPVKVDPAELIQRPTEALDPFIEERVNRAITPMRDQLSRMEQMLGASILQNHHQDAGDITKSEEFREWVQATPLRRSIANLASNGNTQATDELLSEFKATRTRREGTDNQDEAHLARASSVSLEQSRSGGGAADVKPRGKTYTRTQMRQLMQSREYENDDVLRAEVQSAYVQGRVVGD